MSLTVFLAVLFSAFFQASWNFFTKRSKADKISLLAVGWGLLGLLLLPFALIFTPWSQFSEQWTWFILGSAVIHAIYVCLLGWAYSVGDISVVYPVARGLGIVGTTVLSVGLGLHSISPLGLAGILFVVLGTFFIGLKEIPHRHRRLAFVAAALVALTVSGYSVVDSQGAKVVPTLLYIMTMNLLTPLVAAPFLWWRMRTRVKSVLRGHKLEALLVASAGASAYTIILWAFQESPVAYVATLREFSVVIASALGIVFLREPLGKRKLIGIALIVVGAIAIKSA